MEKKKMYSFEVVNKATSAVAMGFSCEDNIFKESIKELPEEVQAMVLASVLVGHIAINAQMRQVLSKASEIEKKNPAEENAERLSEEAIKKMDEEKQAILRELSYTSQLNEKVDWELPIQSRIYRTGDRVT